MGDAVNYDIELRMRQLINAVLDDKPDWKKMEELTGTGAVKWRHFIAAVKKPSIEMLEALCTTYPQYAFWLATGISDEDNGHLAPRTLFFPGKLKRGEIPFNDQESTIAYFKACQQAASTLWKIRVSHYEHASGRSITKLTDDDQRWGLGHWLHSDPVAAAMGKEEIAQFMQKLGRQQRLHKEETLMRLRIYNAEADEIIDKQRAEENELERELEEKWRTRDKEKPQNGNKKD